MEDNDTLALRLAATAVTAMDVAYRNAGTMEQIQMQSVRDQLWTAYALARNRLLAAGVIVTDADLAQMRALDAELSEAADTMAIAGTAMKVAGMLARIALV